MLDMTPQAIIETLGLEPHPEGGWYRETWRADSPPGERACATAIFFLLEPGQTAHWHRVDAAELWLWHAGQTLTLSLSPGENGPVSTVTLGPDVTAGHVPQALVPPGQWQMAMPDEGWTLVSCVVSPGFEFSGWEMAPRDWEPDTG
jgi:hypothetical protein